MTVSRWIGELHRKSMENRNKFYSTSRDPHLGLWSSDTLSQRIKHINGVLGAYKNGALNKEDVKFAIKNAFVSKIYISEDAKNHLNLKNLGNLKSLYGQLINDCVLDLQDGIYKAPNSTLRPYFDICKLGGKGLGVRIEHVVPANVYIEDVLKNTYNDKKLKELFNKLSICIITSKQAKDLDKKYRNEMPIDKSTNHPIDYKDKPFARYDKALGGIDIDVHGWAIKNGNLV